MDWSEFLGHQRQRKWFANAIEQNKLASTFLMVGPDGIGKRTFAKLVAKSLLCNQTDPGDLAFCNRCETCLQVEKQTHPDVIYLARDRAKSVLTVDQLLGSDAARMREGFCYELRIRPYSGRRKIAIIDDADTLKEDTANCLLKTLEEPPPGAVIFLLGTSEKRQISTIRSRSQIVRFSPLSNQHVAELILRHKFLEDPTQALQLAERSHGSIQHAKELNDPNLIEFRSQIYSFLQQRPMDFIEFSKAIIEHLNNATADGQPRRDRFKWCLDEVTEVLRNSLWIQMGVPFSGATDPSLRFAPLKNLPVRTIVRLIELTQETRENINRYIAPAALLEAWAVNFARLARL
jgi:DNA polymerase III subunit delta'